MFNMDNHVNFLKGKYVMNINKHLANQLDRLVLDHVKTKVNDLEKHELTNISKVFDKELWDPVEPVVHRSWGHSISRLVKKGLLPLEYAGFTGQRANQYRKI